MYGLSVQLGYFPLLASKAINKYTKIMGNGCHYMFPATKRWLLQK